MFRFGLSVLLCVGLVFSFNTLPFPDCMTGDLDLVFMLKFSDDIMPKQFINILNILLDIRRISSGLWRIAVYEVGLNYTRTSVLSFTDLYPNTSAIQIFDNINTLINTFNKTAFMINDHPIIELWEKHQWYYKNVILIDEHDDLRYDYMLISLKLCGICPKGWAQFQQQSYTTSCYKVIKKKHPVSSSEAEGICSQYKSNLVNIESRKELKFIQKILSSVFLKPTTKTEILQRRIPLGLQLFTNREPFRYQWSNERPFMLGSYDAVKQFDPITPVPCVSMSVLKERNDMNILLYHDCNLRSFNVFICERDVLRNWTSFDQLNPDQIMTDVAKETTHIGREFLFNCQENDQYISYYIVCDGKLDCQSRLDEDFCSEKQQKRYHQIKYNDLKNKIYRKQFQNFLSKTSDLLIEFEETHCNSHQVCLPAQWFITDKCQVTLHEDHGVLCINERCSRTFEYVLCDSEIEMVNIMEKNCSQRNTTRCPVDERINWAPKCIYLRGRSGYSLGCPDLSHLENCENFTCPDDMVKCPLSYCIQVHYVGDGIMDCIYGEDEYYLVLVGNDQLKQCPNTSPHVCHSPRDAISSCDDLLADKTKRVLLWIMASVSFIGNVVVLSYRYLIDRDILKLSYGVFIINLGISDFIMSIYLIIIAAMDIYYRDVYVLNEHQWQYSPLCKAAGFLSTLSSETSTFFVLLVTIDRFLAIRFPFGNYRFSKTHVILSVFLIWTVGFVIALIPILFTDVALYSSNGMCLGLPLYYNQEPGWTYAMSIFIILNFVIFTLIATGQAAIYIAATTGNTTLVVNQSKRKRDVDVAKQLCLIAMSNFLCWFPVSLIGLLSMTGSSVSLETFAWIVVFVLPLNSAVNPNIYTIPFVYKKWKQFKEEKNTRSNSGNKK
ncbi:hypothetical protein Btru_043002 [Bulinus truncatus]|nr:hypothetical protein Btru_043002 [Bulinus truncatus]